MCRFFITLALTTGLLSGADPWCPAYPREQRLLDLSRIEIERSAQTYAVNHKQPFATRVSASVSFIDDQIFGAMSRAGIEPAPPTTDAEFLRRVTLDLTGRIPKPEQVEAFLADTDPNKRAALIDSLMGSEAFVDQWTLFFGNLFEVTSGYYNLIGIQGRNLFHFYLRDFVTRDRSYKDVASELITGHGDSHKTAPPNFLIRGIQQGDPIQDTWDTVTDRITSSFLGVKTECVSCHAGRGHLEQINVYLTARRREEFWRQSAFVSRMVMTSLPIDAFNQQMHYILTDRLTGGYHGIVNVNNPGPRPPRPGGPYSPVYMFTGERPRNGDWRKELARILTADRQFARTAVNYIWSHFFTVGIVDPPDAWDLARIDPKNPPPAPWTLQPTHPELLEALAEEFIRSDYSVRRIIRLIAESSAYQLSSRYPGEWRPEYARCFAKHVPRRLSAEEAWDAMSIATMTETPVNVEGFAKPLLYASQMPDPTEPRNYGQMTTFLNNFGRGNWWQNGRNSQTTVLQVLYMMNDGIVNYRTFANQVNSRNTRIHLLMQSPMSSEDAVKQLYLATLGRYPTDDEMAAIRRNTTFSNREQMLTDVQWALLNKLDFIFNY